jgi:hypothetical protein
MAGKKISPPKKKPASLKKGQVKKNNPKADQHIYEIELEKKKKQLLIAKKRYKQLAGEFIDLWVKVKRAQRGIV